MCHEKLQSVYEEYFTRSISDKNTALSFSFSLFRGERDKNFKHTRQVYMMYAAMTNKGTSHHYAAPYIIYYSLSHLLCNLHTRVFALAHRYQSACVWLSTNCCAHNGITIVAVKAITGALKTREWKTQDRPLWNAKWICISV